MANNLSQVNITMENSTSIKIFHQQAKINYSILVQDKVNHKTFLKYKTKIIGIELHLCGFPISGMLVDFGIIKKSIKQVISFLNQKFLFSVCSSDYKTNLIDDSILIETNLEEVFEFPRRFCVVAEEDCFNSDSIYPFIGRLIHENFSSEGIPVESFKLLISKSGSTMSSSLIIESCLNKALNYLDV